MQSPSRITYKMHKQDDLFDFTKNISYKGYNGCQLEKRDFEWTKGGSYYYVQANKMT